MEIVSKIYRYITHLNMKKKIQILLGIFYVVGVSTLFYIVDNMADYSGEMLFWSTIMPGKENALKFDDLKKGIQSQFEDFIDPIQLIYSTVPYYKSKSIVSGIYEEEVAGYFGITKEEELVTLEEENFYTPAFPTPQKETVELDRLYDLSYVSSTFYMGGDGHFEINEKLLGQWNFKELADMPIRLNEDVDGPQVLIFHTHSKEKFEGEEMSNEADLGIIAVGEALKKELEGRYGIEVLHVTDSFYMNENSTDVTGQYERMEPVITSIINQNPSLQISLDLHRDGVNEDVRLVGDYQGEDAAKIMFVNGLCQTSGPEGENIPMKTLQNPYLEESLAFSLQAQIEFMKYYPELIRKIYLKAYRYSLHMLPYSLLIEVGAQTNTLEEAIRSVEPIAHVIAKVLEKD